MAHFHDDVPSSLALTFVLAEDLTTIWFVFCCIMVSIILWQKKKCITMTSEAALDPQTGQKSDCKKVKSFIFIFKS